MRHERLPSGAELIVNTPATHARAPERRGLVRGRLRGIHLVEPRGDGCLYTCIHEIDPAGNAPAGVALLLDARRGKSTQAPRKLVNWFALRKPLVYCAQVRALAEVR